MNARYLIYVHGIGRHDAGFSDPWWQALHPFTAAFGDGTLGETRREVLWSPLVNAVRAAAAPVLAEMNDAEQLGQRIRDVLEDRQRREAAAGIIAARAAAATPSLSDMRVASLAGASSLTSGFAIDDFLVYLTSATTRRSILDTFTEVVRPLLLDDVRLDVIAHSWGTVVAYEGLCALEADTALTGRVGTLFTVGSALSIPPVRWRLLPANQDGRRPGLAQRWINLDAEGDIVGGALADWFAVDADEVELEPVGCQRTLGGWGWYPPECAHGSYFHAANDAVNSGIFARLLAADT